MNWCNIIGHRWKYYHEEHYVTAPINGMVKVPVRECKRCQRRQHHLMPMCNGRALSWNWFRHKPGAVINTVPMGSINVRVNECKPDIDDKGGNTG